MTGSRPATKTRNGLRPRRNSPKRTTHLFPEPVRQRILRYDLIALSRELAMDRFPSGPVAHIRMQR
jgi:hypothetical protein